MKNLLLNENEAKLLQLALKGLYRDIEFGLNTKFKNDEIFLIAKNDIKSLHYKIYSYVLKK